MADELHIVDPDVSEKIVKIFEHLSDIENRGFVIAGNLPLTFGSVISVSRPDPQGYKMV